MIQNLSYSLVLATRHHYRSHYLTILTRNNFSNFTHSYTLHILLHTRNKTHNRNDMSYDNILYSFIPKIYILDIVYTLHPWQTL